MSIVVSAPTEPRSRVSHITDVEKTSLQGRHTKPKLTKGDVRPTHSQREGRVHVSSGASISHSPLCAVCVVFVPIMQFFLLFVDFAPFTVRSKFLFIISLLWFIYDLYLRLRSRETVSMPSTTIHICSGRVVFWVRNPEACRTESFTNCPSPTTTTTKRSKLTRVRLRKARKKVKRSASESG